ncbi:MAG: hypothetical protein CVU42_13895 [Chloroflexi bacterium HGW-Chloroflexi-4]|jgi:hypothetical protein|nr:MAG: hypothetical protein CVU42_13895 [Chloroflexi bacterium HGW-Chloroflexi-4]
MYSWIVDGVETNLDDGVLCYLVGSDGLGMMPFHRIADRGPLQHGDTDRGYRYDPRMINLALQIFAEDISSFWAKRNTLLRMFTPNSNRGIFKWELGSDIRQIEAIPYDGLTFSSKDASGLSQKTGIILKCNDPAWYDPAAKSVELLSSGGGGASGGAVPTAVPTSVGSSGVNASVAINYEGNVDSYPFLVRITGPITSPIITNLVTNEKIDFSGYTIADGDHYDLDLRFGQKTVVNSSGTNKSSEVASSSDLTTFRIIASPDAADGVNSIQLTGSAVGANTRLDISYYNRFSGI